MRKIMEELEDCPIVMDKGDGIFLAEEIIKLSFGLDNSFERTESLQMSFAYVSDNPIIRFGYSAKKLDFPRMVGAHLNDGKVMFRF